MTTVLVRGDRRAVTVIAFVVMTCQLSVTGQFATEPADAWTPFAAALRTAGLVCYATAALRDRTLGWTRSVYIARCRAPRGTAPAPLRVLHSLTTTVVPFLIPVLHALPALRALIAFIYSYYLLPV